MTPARSLSGSGLNRIRFETRSGTGGAEEDRTPDLRIANATLSRLSYGPGGCSEITADSTPLRGECHPGMPGTAGSWNRAAPSAVEFAVRAPDGRASVNQVVIVMVQWVCRPERRFGDRFISMRRRMSSFNAPGRWCRPIPGRRSGQGISRTPAGSGKRRGSPRDHRCTTSPKTRQARRFPFHAENEGISEGASGIPRAGLQVIGKDRPIRASGGRR